MMNTWTTQALPGRLLYGAWIPDEALQAGGKPSKGTPADKRLAGNKPKPAMKPKPAPKKGK